MKKNCTLLLIIIFTFLFSFQVSAADLFTTSAKTQINVNDIFDIYINVNTAGDIINSSEGNISFPSDLLSVVSVNNNSSIFSIWPEKPVFSNQNGTMSFNGGLPNPGFSGTKGSVLKITFKAKKAGVAPISIASGSVYSNDGTGTDVLKGKRGITITIKESLNQEPVLKKDEDDLNATKTEVVKNDIKNNLSLSLNTPGLPIISSRELSSLDNWSTQKNILLEWDIPKGVDAVQYSIDSNEISIPNVLKIPPLNNTQLINMANGISNFHIRFRNQNGWGPVLHQKIRVDIIQPEVVSIDQKDNNGLISLYVSSKDIHSGIDKIKVLLGGDKSIEIKADSDVVKIDLPLLKTGDNNIKVLVYDIAGNYVEKEVVVKYSRPRQPSLSLNKEDFVLGKENTLLIKSYPNTDLMLLINDINSSTTENVILKTDNSGIINYDLSNIKTAGQKKIWVSLNNDCGDICVLSEQIDVNISEKPMMKLGNLYNMSIKSIKNVNFGENTLPWIIAFIFMMLYLLSFRRNTKNKNVDILRELNKAEIDVYKIFKVLKTDARRYKTMLKRNNIDVIEKDKKIIENLEQDLDEAETYFAKRIEKIESELEP